MDPAIWERLPHTYVRLTDDRSMPLAAQGRHIADADAATPQNPFDMHAIPGSHGGVLRRPDDLVDVLTGL